MDDRATTFRERVHAEHGIEIELHEIDTDDDPQVSEIAAAVGCEPGQIARAEVVMADTLAVAVVGGSDELDPRVLATQRGVHRARAADTDEIESALGWPADGLPPLCHDSDVPVYVDETLTGYDTVWAMAGTPESVFSISPDRLVACADATVADIVG
jgi:prolyl-tRNA editing enzyme YbaK/EbsC (Cys-tRNA(Pro) deacylase)